jgi:hypothetical protein
MGKPKTMKRVGINLFKIKTMKKAKIVLTTIALFAVIGGALAFKASRILFGKVFYTTTAYSTFNTLYTRAGLVSFCFYTSSNLYWTDVGSPLYTSFRTTAFPTTSLILTRVGGTQTIIIPYYSCVLTQMFTTNVAN